MRFYISMKQNQVTLNSVVNVKLSFITPVCFCVGELRNIMHLRNVNHINIIYASLCKDVFVYNAFASFKKKKCFNVGALDLFLNV